MVEVVSPFMVRYIGKSADHHFLDSKEYGESLIGASKLYITIAEYIYYGEIPKPNAKNKFICVSKVPKKGSFGQEFGIEPAQAGEFGVVFYMFKEPLSWIFRKIVEALLKLWTHPSEQEAIVKELVDVIREKAEQDAKVMEVLVAANQKANDNLAALMEKLTEQIPLLAESTRPYAREFVKPIGSSCSAIEQFSESESKSEITESDAKAIRDEGEIEVGDATEYRVVRIRELNLDTGHCVVDVEFFGEHITGRITDPAIGIRQNIYSQALNDHSEFIVVAKVEIQKGIVKRLHISDAKVIA